MLGFTSWNMLIGRLCLLPIVGARVYMWARGKAPIIMVTVWQFLIFILQNVLYLENVDRHSIIVSHNVRFWSHFANKSASYCRRTALCRASSRLWTRRRRSMISTSTSTRCPLSRPWCLRTRRAWPVLRAGRSSRTAVWISRLVIVDLLLWWARWETSDLLQHIVDVDSVVASSSCRQNERLSPYSFLAPFDDAGFGPIFRLTIASAR